MASRPRVRVTDRSSIRRDYPQELPIGNTAPDRLSTKCEVFARCGFRQDTGHTPADPRHPADSPHRNHPAPSAPPPPEPSTPDAPQAANPTTPAASTTTVHDHTQRILEPYRKVSLNRPDSTHIPTASSGSGNATAGGAAAALVLAASGHLDSARRIESAVERSRAACALSAQGRATEGAKLRNSSTLASVPYLHRPHDHLGICDCRDQNAVASNEARPEHLNRSLVMGVRRVEERDDDVRVERALTCSARSRYLEPRLAAGHPVRVMLARA